MWKFFTKKNQLMWTTNPGSICQFVCHGMHLKPQFKEKWWHLNQGGVMKELNRKRSDVASAMKKAFMGKFRSDKHVWPWNILKHVINTLSCL